LIDRQITSGPTLSELTAFFDAFAYRPVTRESLDHVSVEAGTSLARVQCVRPQCGWWIST
jgi:hypothetical protein